METVTSDDLVCPETISKNERCAASANDRARDDAA